MGCLADNMRKVGSARGEVFAQAPAVKALEHRQAPVGGAGLAAGVARHRVVAQVGFIGGVERGCRRAGEPLRIQRQVAPVGGQRVGRQAVLDPQRIDEAVDRGGAVV
jgi:hypothetical protein